ncbi:hypothetical protein [Caniella muris]|uniref:hypothetical protein n=1 Tax=Caniella muris TaxID=2941502 RepID=UPI00203F92F8|nr:hypothetical protein [Caniella muris]
MQLLRIQHLAHLSAALCLLVTATAGCLTACSQNRQPTTAAEPTETRPPSQGNDTANGGFWYQDLAVTYLGPSSKANGADPTVSLAIESPAPDGELPATVDAVARVSFDGFEPGQHLSVDLSYGPVSPGPDQPCVYSVWRVTPTPA